MALSMLSLLLAVLWLGNVMVRPLHSQSRGGKFDFWSFPHQATTLGNLFVHVPLSPTSIICYRSKAAILSGWECKPCSNGSLLPHL